MMLSRSVISWAVFVVAIAVSVVINFTVGDNAGFWMLLGVAFGRLLYDIEISRTRSPN